MDILISPPKSSNSAQNPRILAGGSELTGNLAESPQTLSPQSLTALRAKNHEDGKAGEHSQRDQRRAQIQREAACEAVRAVRENHRVFALE